MNKKNFVIILTVLFSLLVNQAYSANPEYIESFEQARQEAREQNKKVLLIFGAEWCKWCLILKRDIETPKGNALLDNFVVCYVDYDQNRELAKRYRVSALPATCIISNNRYTRIEGYSNFDSYKNLIESRKSL